MRQQCLAHHTAQRDAQDHGQGSTGGQQAQRLGLLARRRHTHRQRGGDGPEHRMRQGNADTADQQHGEALRKPRQQVADNEHQEHEQQQTPPFDVAGQQHHGQRGQRHDPGIDGQHQADLGSAHVEAAANVTEQRHRDELGGVENEGRQGQGDDAQPAAAARCGWQVCGYGSVHGWKPLLRRQSNRSHASHPLAGVPTYVLLWIGMPGMVRVKLGPHNRRAGRRSTMRALCETRVQQGARSAHGQAAPPAAVAAGSHRLCPGRQRLRRARPCARLGQPRRAAAPATEHLLDAWLAALQAANRPGMDEPQRQAFREAWPPAHHPLIPLLEDHGQGISMSCCWKMAACWPASVCLTTRARWCVSITMG